MSRQAFSDLFPHRGDPELLLLAKLLALVAPPDYSTGCYFLGDSITTGSAATSRADAYPALVAGRVGATEINVSLSGANIAGIVRQGFPGYTHPISGYDDGPTAITRPMLSVVKGDYNGLRDFGNTAAYQTHYERALRAVLLHLAVADEDKVTGQSADATATGTWSADTHYGGAMGKKSSTNGDTISFTATGERVYVVMMAYTADVAPYTAGVSGRPDSSGSTFDLAIDGVSQLAAQSTSVAYGDRLAYSNADATGAERLDYVAHCWEITGLTDSRHTVLITVANGVAAKPVSFLFGAGSGDIRNESGTGPQCLLANTLLPTVAGGVSLTTDALINTAIAAFHDSERRVVRGLAASGANIGLADTQPFYDRTTAAGDNVHPDDDGHEQIADAIVAAHNHALQLGKVSNPKLGPDMTAASAGAFTTLTASLTTTLTGLVTVLNRLLVTPATGAGGSTSRFGANAVAASAFSLTHSDTGLDRRLDFYGNGISCVVNSTGAGANMAFGTVGFTCVFSGAMTVAQTLGVTGAFSVVADMSGQGKLTLAPTSAKSSVFGGDTTSKSSITLVHGEALDRDMTVGGNAIQCTTHSSGAAANMSMQALGGNLLLFNPTLANLGVGTSDFGSGTGMIGLKDRSVAPSGTPAAGGVLYSDAGALKWKGSSGTVTTIAPA